MIPGRLVEIGKGWVELVVELGHEITEEVLAQPEEEDVLGVRPGQVPQEGRTGAHRQVGWVGARGIGRATGANSWLGLDDEAEEDHFVWESDPGELISIGNTAQGGHFVRWIGGEPNDAGGTHNENCVFAGPAGNWDDVQCGGEYRYVCERAIAPF